MPKVGEQSKRGTESREGERAYGFSKAMKHKTKTERTRKRPVGGEVKV